MVVAWKTLGFWLGSMRGSGVEPSGWGPVAVDATPAACVLVGAASAAPAGGRWSIVLLALRPRVGGVVDLGQVLEIQVGVDLGGGRIIMTEQLLHAAQVAGGLEHVAGVDRKSVLKGKIGAVSVYLHGSIAIKKKNKQKK